MRIIKAIQTQVVSVVMPTNPDEIIDIACHEYASSGFDMIRLDVNREIHPLYPSEMIVSPRSVVRVVAATIYVVRTELSDGNDVALNLLATPQPVILTVNEAEFGDVTDDFNPAEHWMNTADVHYEPELNGTHVKQLPAGFADCIFAFRG